MKSSSLESKTVRPGLNSYSFYHSDRHPASQNVAAPQTSAGRKPWRFLLTFVVVLAVVAVGLRLTGGGNDAPSTVASTTAKTTTSKKPTTSKQPAVAPVTNATPSTANQCADNTLAKFIVVDVSARHLWACEGSKSVHDSPVITGMEAHASTLTPRGTYKIYGKVADTVLTGSDETGSWRDPVSYWMPFLDNQYGTYGFHDATWRKDSEFGTVDPNSSDASHGCVELPLDTSTWLYGWAAVGTSLKVQS